MKRILLIISCLCMSQNIHAQDPQPEKVINTEYYQKVNTTFGRLDRTKIPKGILADMAFPFANLKAYNGTLTDSTQITVEVLGEIYKTLQSARISPTTEKDFVPIEDFANIWSNYRKNANTDENDITLVLSALHYKYAALNENAFKDRKIHLDGEVLSDVYINGVWQNPYDELETVAVAPPLSVLNTLTFSVILPSELFLSNTKDKGITEIYADFDDGQGYVPVNFNQKIKLNYTAAGKFNWKFKLIKWDGSILIVDNPILITDPIEVLPIPNIGKNNVVIQNGKYNAILRIDYASGGGNKIKKPLIVAEGFDPESVLYPEKLGGSTSIGSFINSINNQNSELRTLLNSNSQQYDIVYVDWKNGIGDIKQNAETLIKVIEWVNNEKQANGSTVPNVVIGQSMGGLVASYALSKMEKANKQHQTALFIAHDSPFQGANTPVSTQMMFRHLKSTYLSNPFAAFIGEILIPALVNLESLLNISIIGDGYLSPCTALGIQDAPAALQMTKYHVTPNSQVTTVFFDHWKNEFDTMGHPTQTRNIAISNGNMCAEPQIVKGGEQMFLEDKILAPLNEFKNIGIHLGASLWGFTSGNFKLGVIALIPGKPKIDYLLDMRAIPEQDNSNRVVYRAKVHYRVKYLQVFGTSFYASTAIVPLRQITVASNLLPLETFSGGTNNIQSVAEGFSDKLKINSSSFLSPIYGFIPVASALDIRRNNGDLTISDYRSAYNTTDIIDSNLITPFENFNTERTVGNRQNFNHISFSLKNSNWLATELIQNDTTTNTYPTNCSFICEASEIFGVDNLCLNKNYVFSVPLVEGATYNWNTFGLVLVSGQGTSSLTVKAVNTFGFKSISVNINTAECGNLSLSKNIRVGVPKLNGPIEGDQILDVFSYNYAISPIRIYTAPTTIGATYYEWTLPGNYQAVNTLNPAPNYTPDNWLLLNSTANTNEIKVMSNQHTDGTIKVRGCNECGCSDYVTLDVTHRYRTSNPDYVITPNPGKNIIEIFNTNQNKLPVFKDDKTFVKVYDLQAQVRHTFEINTKGGKTDISHLPTGLYKVEIDMQNGAYEVLNLMISR